MDQPEWRKLGMTAQQHVRRPRDWRLCRLSSRGCRGVRVDPYQDCWAHLDRSHRQRALSRLGPGRSIDARGTLLTPELLANILDAMRRGSGPPELGQASFDEAQFIGEAQFRDVHFRGDAWFDGARFSQDARFRGARFSGNARFMGTQFDGDARLEEARLEAERVLGPVLVKGRLALDETTVDRHLLIEAFTRQFTCIGTEFLQGATIRLQGADIVLDHCILGRPTTISFSRLPFRERRGGLTPEGGLGPELFTGKYDVLEGVELPPRLLSMRGVDVSDLTLVELDLRRCLFQGSHKRAELRIVGAQPFTDTPNNWVRPLGIPLWRHWTHRQVLAEEHKWRHDDCSPGSWYPPECQYPDWFEDETGQKVDDLNPDRLASIYRALRKSQEDNKNEPGAADFYYGEMEMRRLAKSAPWAERLVLNVYWLISGYSLRGLRTVLALLVMLAVSTWLIAAVGFPDPTPVTTFTTSMVRIPPRQFAQTEPQPATTVTSTESFGVRLRTAAVVALEGAVFRASEQELSYMGRAIQDLVRIVGPILIGLTLLSVRNRVKR
jgi:uncharacterized protein YjbI with pentapeptide repeats